jgi:hypothetical protein
VYTGNKENAPERNKTVESRQRKVTRKDVAEEAGVSETIVSYVLNKNIAYISQIMSWPTISGSLQKL